MFRRRNKGDVCLSTLLKQLTVPVMLWGQKRTSKYRLGLPIRQLAHSPLTVTEHFDFFIFLTAIELGMQIELGVNFFKKQS